MEENDIKDTIEAAVNSSMKKYFKNGAKKLNLYTMLQVMWILELYYLGANEIYEFLVENPQIIKGFNIDTICLPKEIAIYNNLIKEYFSSWSSFVIFFAIAMIICGVCFTFIRLIPVLRDYRLIYVYSSYGAVVGTWLILIYFTYYLYLKIGIIFMIIPIFISMGLIAIEKLKKYLKRSPIINLIEVLYPDARDW